MFTKCNSLTSMVIPNGVRSIGYQIFQYCQNLTSVTILYGTQTIGYSAFSYCSSLQSVALPGSVTSIGEFAFARCSSLSSITIPNSLTSLGNFVFMDCSGLTSIYCYAQQPPTLGAKVFEGVNKTIPLYVLENSVSLYRAANQWKDFTNINGILSGLCGDSVNWAIQDSVFVISGTGSMTDYSYSNPAPWTAYQNVFNRVVIHEGVTTIGDWAFSTCSNILSVTLPNTLTSIGDWAFAYCTILDTITCFAVVPPAVEDFTFEEVPTSAKLFVPAGSVAAYQADSIWGRFFIQPIEATDLLNVENDNSLNGSVRDLLANPETKVYNLQGCEVSVNRNDLPAGVYILRLNNQAAKVTIR